MIEVDVTAIECDCATSQREWTARIPSKVNKTHQRSSCRRSLGKSTLLCTIRVIGNRLGTQQEIRAAKRTLLRVDRFCNGEDSVRHEHVP